MFYDRFRLYKNRQINTYTCLYFQERAEVRTARVSLVIGLMSLLPRKAYRKFVKWLIKLSTTSKVSHRQISLVSTTSDLCLCKIKCDNLNRDIYNLIMPLKRSKIVAVI